MAPTILITALRTPELEAAIRRLAPEARLLSIEEVHAHPELLAQVDIVYGRLDRDLFPAATRLKWLQTTFAGMEWAAVPEICAHPVILTNARIHAEPIAEHLFGLLLMLTRALHLAVRQQEKHCWDGRPLGGRAEILAGKTLCVVGLGVIGRRCVELGQAFGMQVIGVRRHPQPVPGVAQVYGDTALREALGQADVVMVILPNTPQTRKMFGPAEFAAMRDGVLFLNAGRGQTVDTEALMAALRSGKLGGAGLDVVDPEPLPSDHPLWDLPNAIITPHYSGGFPGYADAANRIFLENLRRFLAGEPLEFVVDKTAGY